ncbi:MAG: hypothetical protein MUP98_17220 [Candidatus Aminicenantes bacterium]|nr:hypothetical protein [Candidatus Aminicenantes bacterium]
MNKYLKDYLEQIDHYLSVQDGKNEILDEIKSHILEKAEDETGEVNEATIKDIISKYGSPQRVAEKYMDDVQIISPTFKKYLWRYTGYLFSIHCLLILGALLFLGDMYLFPFFYIPEMGIIQALNYIPMAFVYDIGLVGLVLFFITQRKKDIRLPWPKFGLKVQRSSPKSPRSPKTFPLILMIFGFIAVLFVFLKYGTLYFYSLNPGAQKSLFGPTASLWYSLALIIFFAVGILSYAARFFWNPLLIDLIKYPIYLAVFLVVLNNPIEDAWINFQYFDLKTPAVVLVGFITALYTYLFLKTLVLVGKEYIGKR